MFPDSLGLGLCGWVLEISAPTGTVSVEVAILKVSVTAAGWNPAVSVDMVSVEVAIPEVSSDLTCITKREKVAIGNSIPTMRRRFACMPQF